MLVDRFSDFVQFLVSHRPWGAVLVMRLILAILFVLTATIAGNSADVKFNDQKDGNTVIHLSGDIEIGDANAVSAIIKSTNSKNRLVSAIRLNSIGGNLSEAVKLAEIVRYGKIATVVPGGSECASACFVVFAAGYEKFASYTSNVGVHGASDQHGDEAGDATVLMGRIVKELGVPPAIIGKMVVTPPDQIVWLSPDDLRSMDVTLTGKPSQLPSAQQIPPQQRDDISRHDKGSWEEIVNGAYAKSQTQNNGSADVARGCDDKTKECITAIFFRGRDGNKIMVRTSEVGSSIIRDICVFNSSMDIRSCQDWDSGRETREVNKKGEWYSIGD